MTAMTENRGSWGSKIGFYSVVGGWTIAYVFEAVRGDVLTTDGAALEAAFTSFIGVLVEQMKVQPLK